MDINISQYIRDFLERVDEAASLTNSEIAEKILKENKEIAKHYKNNEAGLKKLVSKIRIQEGVLKVSTKRQPKELKTPYKVLGGKHYFYPIKGEFSIPNELVDKLFYSFSKHGLDLSQTQILNKYNLEPWQWHAVKNALKLYKLSNIFSPHTVENTDPEVMKEMVREKLDQRINTLGFTIEEEYKKSIINKYKDFIKKSTVKDLVVTTILTELQDLLPKVSFEKPTRVEINGSGKVKDLTLVISDIHFGLNNNNSSVSPIYSVDKVKVVLDEIAKEVNSYGAERVHILNLGDIIETFQGNNHLGSWKGIETGFYGSRLVIECYKLIVEFLLQINNLSSYSQLPGNHDRSSSNNKEDVEGFIAEIVFEFIKNSFMGSDISFEYQSTLISKEIGNLNYIATHGHLDISKMPASELILEYAPNPNKFTLLLQGHFHSRKVKREHKMFRDLVIPAIMPGNNYSVTAGYSSSPGYVIIKEKEGKPIVIDYTL